MDTALLNVLLSVIPVGVHSMIEKVKRIYRFTVVRSEFNPTMVTVSHSKNICATPF
ncbi:hypothetical protein [Sphingobacterium siyangense]|uniref:hypothetical protein n=1 Tax=Sphingobacterium siyangense TaxID=459529 RepID=UPI001962BB09|nr:hypothetical protein [Sphingobacterium siyangense]QRY55244.1 hypothetical protein JVX97_14440 [Sphingobacterium siyangense]